MSDAAVRIGQCIYCGAKHGPLSREHVIPRGLGGTLTIHEASCSSCAEITSAFEQQCLRGMFASVRAKIGIRRSRKDGDRPDLYRTPIRQADGSAVTAFLPLSDLPFGLAMPTFEAPGILAGLAPDTTWSGDTWYRVDRPALNAFGQQHGGTSMGIGGGPINCMAFGRLIAKIAYSYAVSRRGVGSIQPLVLDLIFGKATCVTHWIGQLGEHPPTDANCMHKLRIIDRIETSRGEAFTGAYVRLFAGIGAPEYVVVLGTL